MLSRRAGKLLAVTALRIRHPCLGIRVAWLQLVILLAVFAACADATTYRFTTASIAADACVQGVNSDGSCTAVDDWSSVHLATTPFDGGAMARVYLAGDLECSHKLLCKDWGFPVYNSTNTWENVYVENVTIGFYYDFPIGVEAKAVFRLIDGSGTESLAARIASLGSAANMGALWPSRFGLDPFPYTDAASSSFGVSFWLQRDDPGSIAELAVNGFTISVHYAGDASVIGVLPYENVDVGTVVTVSGSFFDTTDIIGPPTCRFRRVESSGGWTPIIASLVTSSSVECQIPDVGDSPGALNVTVNLDPAQDDIAPGTLVYYRQAAPVSDKDNKRTAKSNFPAVIIIAAVSTGGIAVVGAAAVLAMRRGSTHGSGAVSKAGAKEPTLSLASAIEVSATLSLDPPPDASARRSSKDAPRRPSKGAARRPSKNAMAKRSKSNTHGAGNSYEAIPMSEFRMTRQSMATEYSVTSEQAPYFPGRR